MDLNIEQLLNSKKRIYFLIDGVESVDSLRRKYSQEDQSSAIKIVDGRLCRTKDSLFQEFAEVLDFPNYFGANWDAFEECIKDLSWLEESRYLLIITNFSEVLVDNKNDLQIFLGIIKSVFGAEDSADNDYVDKQGRIVFQCQVSETESCLKILKETIDDIEVIKLQQTVKILN